MILKLNAKREKYQEFYGRNIEQMPKLVADNRVPMNASQLMQERLYVRNASEDVKGKWVDSFFDTGDAVIYHPEGNVLIDLDSQYLRKMTPESPRNDGALLLSADKDEAFAIYEQLKKQSNVVEFKKGKLGKTLNWLSKKKVKAHPAFKVLARDQALLDDYADYAFEEAEKRSLYEIDMMGIFPGSANGDTPEIRAWCVGGLGSGSVIKGRESLDDKLGCLVGVAPEVPSMLENPDLSTRTDDVIHL
ncbi:MAG: hypothetical protein IIA85_02130 [Nanoarchaeota archaeon]|nr:hypothetical protein [Nanoarchaeota archaeon]